MAQKKAAGSTKNGRDSQGRRLGFKIFGNSMAKPGAIVLRQRGTKFFSGAGTVMGTDHSIVATKAGLVNIYSRNKRVYISIN